MSAQAADDSGQAIRHLLLYFLIPLLINGAAAVSLAHLNPDSALLLIKLPGVLMGISWGWAGLLLCISLGVMLGLPVAAFQSAYVTHKLAQVAEGADFGAALGNPTSAALINLPWFAAAAVGYVAGYVWLFPPLGGPLIAANILWVRSLLYRQHLWLHEHERAYGQQQRQERSLSTQAL